MTLNVAVEVLFTSALLSHPACGAPSQPVLHRLRRLRRRLDFFQFEANAVYAKGAAMALPAADISCDRFHTMAVQAMGDMRRKALRTEPEAEVVAAALLGADPKRRRSMLWGML